MENPRKRPTVVTTASGDGLDLFDHQQQQAVRLEHDVGPGMAAL